MRYFITGGLGFIGYHISKRLLELGHIVKTYDNHSSFVNNTKNRYLRCIPHKNWDADILNKSDLQLAITIDKPDIVIHLAAMPIASLANQCPNIAMDINLQGTINVLESIKELKPRFIYTSSSFVYGNFVHTPANENDPTSPIDFYGGTKLCGEILTKVYSQRYGIPYTIIRPSAVYGPTDCNMRVSQLFIENALEGKPLTIDTNGGAVDFTYVEDTAEGIILASLSDKAINQTFNITTGQGRTTEEFADIINKYVPVKKEYRESNVTRPKRGALDISKAKELLGYRPKFSLEEGIPIYLDYAKGALNDKA